MIKALRVFMLAVVVVLSTTALATPATTGPQAVAAQPLPLLTGTVKIMIAGDSIAAGMGITCPDGSSFGDRWALGDWLALQPGLSVAFVGSQAATCHQPWHRHEGRGGWTISMLADGVPGVPGIGGLLAANPADVLILRVGVNDARAGRTPEQMIADYRRLIDKARAQNPAIRILASEQIGPNGSVNPAYAQASVTVKRFNALLPALAEEFGDAVHIGRFGTLTTRGLGDGLHPDVAGYLWIAWATVHQPDGIWPWLSANPPASTDAGVLYTDPFARWP